MFIFLLTDIAVSIGGITEENQKHQYISNKSHAKARQVLLLIWLVFGFLLTMSYKSVLRSSMIHIYYEKGIDSVEEFLKSDMQVALYGNSSIPKFLAGDKRPKMIEMNKRVIYYNEENGVAPIWVSDG